VSEKPVEVIPGKGKHRVETRIFARRIHESWCAQPGCKFRGQPAAQGICHTTKSFAGDDFSYEEHLSEMVEKHVEHLRKRYAKLSPAHKQRMWESEIACALLNSWFGTDELVRLRRDNALLRDKVRRMKRRVSPKRSQP